MLRPSSWEPTGFQRGGFGVCCRMEPCNFVVGKSASRRTVSTMTRFSSRNPEECLVPISEATHGIAVQMTRLVEVSFGTALHSSLPLPGTGGMRSMGVSRGRCMWNRQLAGFDDLSPQPPPSFRPWVGCLLQDPSTAAITAKRPGLLRQVVVTSGSVIPKIHCYISAGTRSRNRKGELSRLGLEKPA